MLKTRQTRIVLLKRPPSADEQHGGKKKRLTKCAPVSKPASRQPLPLALKPASRQTVPKRPLPPAARPDASVPRSSPKKPTKPNHKAIVIQSATDDDGVLTFHLTGECQRYHRIVSLEREHESRRLSIDLLRMRLNKCCNGREHDLVVPFTLRNKQ